MIKEEDIQAIGQFAKPHGIKGEITLYTDFEWGEDAHEQACIICELDGILTPFFINSCRQKGASSTLVTFDQLDSADKVKFLSGKTAYIPLKYAQSSKLTVSQSSELTVLQELIGYAVIDNRLGTIGPVIGVDNNTINILLIADYKGTEILIPLALATSVEHKQKTINLSLPDGFLTIFQKNET